MGLNSHTPIGGISEDGSWINKICVDQHPTLGSVQRGNFNSVLHGVRPEHVPAQMIDSDAFRTAKIWNMKIKHATCQYTV